MASDGRVELEDKLMRSYGVAANARRLSRPEFMSLLSDIKLALSLGLIDGLEHVTLHRLLIEAQPASLRKRAGRDLTLYERDVLARTSCAGRSGIDSYLLNIRLGCFD